MTFTSSSDEYIIATYSLNAPKGDIMHTAERFAVGQTIGTWVKVPGLDSSTEARHVGQVVDIVEVPPRELDPAPEQRYVLISIAFPWQNFGPGFTQLLTTLLGNDASTSVQAKLISLEVPDRYAQQFPGPRFGIKGIRNTLGISQRPIVLNMIKPCLGFTPEVGANIFYETALGGVDLIKDDELLGDPHFCTVAERAVAYMKASERVYNETGRRVGYLCNISGPPKRMRDNALRAIEAGVTGLMVNFVFNGLDTILELTEDEDLPVPIFAHYAGAGALSEATESGIDSNILLGILPRLAGVDIMLYNTPYGGYPYLRSKYLLMAKTLTAKRENVLPTMPAVGGGVIPQMIPTLMNDLGNDLVIAAGGSVQGHPLGPEAGGNALRQAIDATLNNVDLATYAQDHKELAVALEAWEFQP